MRTSIVSHSSSDSPGGSYYGMSPVSNEGEKTQLSPLSSVGPGGQLQQPSRSFKKRGLRSEKFYKSCDYCRYRKVKCIPVEHSEEATNKRCSYCDKVGIDCIYSTRKISKKRRSLSAAISMRLSQYYAEEGSLKLLGSEANKKLSAAVSGTSRKPDPVDKSKIPRKTDGEEDCLDSIHTAETLNVADAIYEIDSNFSNQEIVQQLYEQGNKYLSPFVPPQLIRDLSTNEVATVAVQLSGFSSLQRLYGSQCLNQVLNKTANLCDCDLTAWDYTNYAFFLLLPTRIKIADGLVDQVLSKFQQQHIPYDYSLMPMFFGAMVIDCWKALVLKRRPFFVFSSSNPDILKFTHEFPEETFFRYFALMTIHLLELLELVWDPDNLFNPFYPCDENLPFTRDESNRKKIQRRWLQMEYKISMFPVQVPTSLLILKDELLSTREAVLLHIFHNTLLIAYYMIPIRHLKSIGNFLGIQPQPGVFHFVCELAKSVFRYDYKSFPHGQLIYDCATLTAELMVEMWNLVQFPECKVALSWLVESQCPDDLAERISNLLREKNFVSDQMDGRSVYWTFRDMRCMTIDWYLQEIKEI